MLALCAVRCGRRCDTRPRAQRKGCGELDGYSAKPTCSRVSRSPYGRARSGSGSRVIRDGGMAKRDGWKGRAAWAATDGVMWNSGSVLKLQRGYLGGEAGDQADHLPGAQAVLGGTHGSALGEAVVLLEPARRIRGRADVEGGMADGGPEQVAAVERGNRAVHAGGKRWV